jgi:hypothetical protein
MGMDKNGCDWMRLDGNGREWMRLDRNGCDWMGMDAIGWEWLRIAANVRFDFSPLVISVWCNQINSVLLGWQQSFCVFLKNFIFIF